MFEANVMAKFGLSLGLVFKGDLRDGLSARTILWIGAVFVLRRQGK